VALPLAIFRSKPNPPCTLDEVGAAPDEANTGRFRAVRGRLGADWARASLALVSGGRKDRYQMLRQAKLRQRAEQKRGRLLAG
jgi:hypothetical protein